MHQMPVTRKLCSSEMKPEHLPRKTSYPYNQLRRMRVQKPLASLLYLREPGSIEAIHLSA